MQMNAPRRLNAFARPVALLSTIRSRLSPPEDQPLPSVDIHTDDVLHLLQVERRREAVRYVDDVGETTISDLADYIAAVETGKCLDEIRSDERKKVYVALYQGHIPKLVENGILEEDRGTLTPTENTAAIAEIVRQLEDASGGEAA